MITTERYVTDEPGFHPFLIRPQWQVAQLNYEPSRGPKAIVKLERHRNSDEVFLLTVGRALLLTATQDEPGLTLAAQVMDAGVVYNIPADRWHWIVMSPDARVFIVENRDTHLNDYEYLTLQPAEHRRVMDLVRSSLG